MQYINLDLDGVFADFEANFRNIVGFNYHDDPKGAWKILEKVDNLFRHLEPIPNSLDMFNEIYVRAKVPVRILTALPLLTGRLRTAKVDKEYWVRRFLDDEIRVICSNTWRDKKNYCNPGDILVDDMMRNIDEWTAVGGVGILHDPKSPEITIQNLVECGAISG